MTDRLQVVVLADGDPKNPNTNSGVASNLLRSLESHSEIAVLDTVNVALTTRDRIAVRLLSIRPTRFFWNRAAEWGLARPLVRSIKRGRTLRKLPRNAIALHVRNFYFPSRRRYAAFIDTTLSLRQKHWPEPELRAHNFWFLKILERFYYQNAVRVFVAGSYVVPELTEVYGVDSAKVTVVGAGAPVIPTLPTDREARNDSVCRVLFVGKEFERKGGPRLVEACRELVAAGKRIELHVVGVSQQLPAYSWLFTYGRVDDHRKLSAIYSECDIFCLPAVFEPYGLVLLEAMAHGLPAVVSDYGVLPELVGNNERGLVVSRQGPPAELSQALLMLVESRSERLRMGVQAESFVSGRDWSDVAQRVVQELLKVDASMDASR